jgi:KDO2-lipid IV(A) lauroyltransferase
MEELQRQMGGPGNPVLLLFRGPTAAAVLEQMHTAEPALRRAVSEGHVKSFRLPTGFWPDPATASVLKHEAGILAARSDEFRAQLFEAGFSTNSYALAAGVLDRWREWSTNASGVPLWPDNDGAKWLSGVVSARDSNGDWIGLGTIETTGPSVRLEGLPPGVLVTGWDRLGPDLMARVGRRVAGLMGVIGMVLVGCLWLAFRRWSEVMLSLAALALSFLSLLAAMAAMGATWNLLNLVALPLLLGTSVDSTIHVQLALRREGGILRALWRTTGVALVLCAGANIAGFGSLAWSSNAGLASLDIVCAGGVLCVLVISLLLLPHWWRWVHPSPLPSPPPRSGGASKLYGPLGWRIATVLARAVPRELLVAVARGLSRIYCLIRPERLEVVESNLLPVVGGDAEQARSVARGSFGEFAEKLVDLWRHEALGPGAVTVGATGGWEPFHEAMGCGRGVLLVTPHLGNWELGGSLLASFGVKPLVLTAPEPGTGLTGMRALARARHGVETLVVGADPFAFVQVIRRLQEGGVVAVLLDRPMSGSGVDVDFFGQTLPASSAAADLARATGAVILPVYVVREGGQHRAYALPPVLYDRACLGSRGERRELTGRILRVFEPAVRQFSTQWFHFVPVWKAKSGLDETKR